MASQTSMCGINEMSWYSRRNYGWDGFAPQMTVGELEARAEQVAVRMTGKISSLMALAAGKIPKELLEDFCNNEHVHLLGANIHDDVRGVR